MCPWLFILVGFVTSCSCCPPVCLSPCGTDPDKLVLWVVSGGPAFSANLLSLQIEAHGLRVCFSPDCPFHQDLPVGCPSLNPSLVAQMAFVVPWWLSPAIFGKWGLERGQQRTVSIWKSVRHVFHHQKHKCDLQRWKADFLPGEETQTKGNLSKSLN